MVRITSISCCVVRFDI